MSHRAICFCLLVLLAVTWRVSADVQVKDLDDDHDHGHLALNDSRATNGTKSNGKTRPIWEPYVYGSLSVTVVSLLSLAGVIVIPFIKRKVTYDGVMLTFMALAVGTMTSDAMLHLVPEALGLHEHEHGHEAHEEEEHEHEEGESEHIGKMTAVLATLYALYLLELILQTAAKLWKKPKVAQAETATTGPTIVKVTSSQKDVMATEEKWSMNDVGHGHGHSHGFVDADDQTTILGLKSVAFVIVLSDAMHNFTDGLAIGAAFSQSSAAGLGVSIAVVCHEIPHEIGNFAILLNTGMGLKKALLLNFLSAVTCFAGLYPGIVAGQQEVLCRWIFAAVAAGFLYVALVHMLRELQHFGSLPWYLAFILQNVGILVGFGIIFLLAIYEEALNGMA